MTRLTRKLLYRKHVAAIVIGAAFVFTSSSGASENKDTAATPSSSTEFLKGALSASEVELRAGKLAERKGQSPQVQNLGRTLANDQQYIQARLQKIADAKNIEKEQSLQPEHQKQLAQLENVSQSDFDQRFVQQIIKDHQRDLEMLEELSERFAADSQISQLVQDHRSTVQKHLRMAQNVADELNGSSATGSAPRTESLTSDSRNRAEEERDAPTREGDGEVLGQPISDNDGTVLGAIPSPSGKVEAGNQQESYVAEELVDGKVNKGVDNVSEADQDTIPVPSTSQREKAASEVVPDRD